ncbi:DoxX family protein [Flavobacterium sp. NKUCC04_CG]|uniref:DoxX family protein n=1 Tax=Flavobacterium sp. NKUCC04_CG TaxID=2842121 RepID=UPI001C5B156D|nr:DoxX family protein [Flavobacterium sp. NKUCC04_CG]MBW3519133.1 DoxX family protein [Flavobacterium sp. NKUCC04_CG]
MKANNDLGLLLIRIVIGLTMLLHGINKIIHGLDYIKGLVDGHGLPTFISYGIYIGEIIAPILIIIGFRTRMASLALVITCICIILFAHVQDVFSLNSNGGLALELIIIYLFTSLGLFFTGGGKMSVSNKNRWD